MWKPPAPITVASVASLAEARANMMPSTLRERRQPVVAEEEERAEVVEEAASALLLPAFPLGRPTGKGAEAASAE